MRIIRPNADSWEVAATLSGSYGVTDQVTTHPVDGRENVADGVRLGSPFLSVRVLETESPVDSKKITVSGPERVRTFLEFLNDARGERLVILLDDDRFPQFDDMVLASQLATIRRLRDLPEDLEFVHVSVASSETIQIAPADRQAAGFTPRADTAEQATGPGGSPADDDDASVLFELLRGG